MFQSLVVDQALIVIAARLAVAPVIVGLRPVQLLSRLEAILHHVSSLPYLVDGLKTIKGLDLELFKQARVAALKAGVNIGQWINEAIKAYLKLNR